MRLASEADHRPLTIQAVSRRQQTSLFHFRPYLRSTGFLYQLLRLQTYFQMQADEQALHLRDDQ